MTSSQGRMSDAQLAELDIAALLRDGLAEPTGSARGSLFGTGAAGAAVILDRLHVIPRSLTYLAEVVRAGGTRYGADLSEPLPEPAQAEIVRPWLRQAAGVVTTVSGDEEVARWLEAVAAIIALRISSRGEELPPSLGD